MAVAVTRTSVREIDTEPAEWMAAPLTLVVVPSWSAAVPSWSAVDPSWSAAVPSWSAVDPSWSVADPSWAPVVPLAVRIGTELGMVAAVGTLAVVVRKPAG